MKTLKLFLILMLLATPLYAADVTVTLTIDAETDTLILSNAHLFGWSESDPRTKEECLKDYFVEQALNVIKASKQDTAYLAATNQVNNALEAEITAVKENMRITVQK